MMKSAKRKSIKKLRAAPKKTRASKRIMTEIVVDKTLDAKATHAEAHSQPNHPHPVDQSQADQPVVACHLLSLPLEIRLVIYEMVAQSQKAPLIIRRTGIFGLPPLASVSSNIRSEVIPTFIRTMEIQAIVQDYDFRDLLYALRRLPATSLHALKSNVAGKLQVHASGKLQVRVFDGSPIHAEQRKELNRESLYSWLRFATSRTGLHLNARYMPHHDGYYHHKPPRLYTWDISLSQELETLANLMCVRAMRQELNRLLKKDGSV